MLKSSLHSPAHLFVDNAQGAWRPYGANKFIAD